MKKNIVPLLVLVALVQTSFADDWFMAQTETADVKSVVATSELVEAQFNGKYLYPPINILDGNYDSTWCEADQSGPGIGESITVEFSQPVSFDEIQIVNGFASKDYYKKNNRVKTIVLTQVAKKHFQQKEYTLNDDTPTWQSINFALPQTAQTITIKITDVYKGSKYDDTCLDDIRLLYKGKVIPFTGVEELKKIQEENSKLMLKSSAADFKSQLLALSYGSAKIYLKSQKDDSAIIIHKSNDGQNITDILIGDAYFIKNGSEEDVIARINQTGFNKMYLNKGDFDSEMEHYYTQAQKKNSEYLLLGWQWNNYEIQWDIGNFRLLKTERIDYVRTTTAIIIKLDGNTVYWNGVPYTVITEQQIFDIRQWDGY
ncbi:MAG: discoidin domain-containing protein [Treponema sp.]|nr:discoidin domain-containing protein [Treponema sp.]